MNVSRILVSVAGSLTLVSCGETVVSTPAPRDPVLIEAVQFRACPDPDPMQACHSDKADAPALLAAALKGDYQAQRNVSYMHTSNSPWIIARPIQGCAWRTVIMASRPADSTLDDAGMYHIQCESLGEADRADAKALAQGIYRRIHGTDLPAVS